MPDNRKLPAATAAAALTMAERLRLELNDTDNAARLLSVHGEDLVFVDGKGWSVWDGSRYSFRSGGLAALEIGLRLREIIQEEAEAARGMLEFPEFQIMARLEESRTRRTKPILVDMDAARAELTQEAVTKLKNHATKCGNLDKVRKALEVAEVRRRVEVDDLDNDPFAFVVTNGQVDLRKAAAWDPSGFTDEREARASKAEWLRPTDRGSLPSKCGGVAFDPHAEAPGWLKFIELILPDQEVRDCVQRILGATLLGENRAQVCIILRGPGGNGKSTLLNGLQNVLGTKDGYAAPCKIEMFLETGNSSSGGPTPEEINLPGARAYIATEPGARDILSAKKIKGLTGGDKRMSRGLNKDFFFWTPRGVPILSCNRTPKIKDEDEGTRRRLVFVPFEVNLRTLPIEEQRPQAEVETELRAEGSGILNWLLDGFSEFMHRGVDMPESMQELKSSLMQSADPVGVFLDDMVEIDPSSRIKVTDFYKVYEKWCDEAGHTLYQSKTVREIMVEKGFDNKKYQGYHRWKGLTWAADAAPIVTAVLGADAVPRTPLPPEAPPF
ncbi:DNA primase family protein [Roseobacter weihaiensis]|uniref:DNA primase family protein n=1 Tax=Roseobacter weihaiensis TaxID=2763262 RepID=UPI001D0ACE7C|nr:phage/plasmid primase, P4 family [Roseobacter sp. H9]